MEYWLGLMVRTAIAIALVSWVYAAPPLENSPATTAPTQVPTPSPASSQKPAPTKDYLAGFVLNPSVFEISPNAGRDPFFPESDRFLKGLKVGTKSIIPPPPDLDLKGISVTRKQRLALINRYTMAEGETREIRVNNHKYKICCLKVGKDSVVIDYRGQKQELSLKPKTAARPNPANKPSSAIP